MSPGVVARGRIKVDARKALDKLRDHMLVDLHLYAVEIARVAVARGATALDVDWDSDDVVFVWDGTPMDAKAVADVRDAVLASEHEEDGGIRGLGIGVLAALGLDVAWVHVDTLDGGACTRVRFDRSYAKTAALPVPEAASIPNDAPSTGMRVHVHRKLGFETLGRFAKKDAPEEIGLLADASRDAPIPVRLRGVDARKPPRVVLRVGLDEPGTTRAVLEVLEPTKDASARIDFLERGFRLVSYPWGPDATGFPVRVLVDAPRLPTNASRSEIRADSEILAQTRDRAAAATEVALDVLVRSASGGGVEMTSDTTAAKLGHAVEIVDPRPEALEEALGAIAANVALSVRAGRDVPPRSRALLELPLLRDAVGSPMSIAAVTGARAVYGGAEPQPRELAPWLGGIPWRRGRAVERVLDDLPLALADALVAVAREGFERRRRALEHPPSKPTLPQSPAYVFKEAFAVNEGPFSGLEGEIALVRHEGPFRRSGAVRVFVEQRFLQALPLTTGLPIDIALAWPDRIRARATYDGVEPSADFAAAVHYALRLGAALVGERAQPRDPELVRLAILAWLQSTVALKDTRKLSSLGPLAREAVWPTSDPSVLVDLRSIGAYAARTHAICTSVVAGRAPDGRPVIRPEHAESLRPFLSRKTQVVPYDAILARSPDECASALARAAAAFPLHVALSSGRGHLCAGPARARVFHQGIALREDERPRGWGFLVIEDPKAVPNATATGAVFIAPLEAVASDEDVLLEAVIGACERGALDPATVKDYLDRVANELARRHLDPRLARITMLPKLAEEKRKERAVEAFLAMPPRPPQMPLGPTAESLPHGARATVVVPPEASNDSWTPPPIAVLFRGRPIGSVHNDRPVFACVDIEAERFVTLAPPALTSEGTALVRRSVAAASSALARKLATELPDFSCHVGALSLAAALASRAEVASVLRKVEWPTVQGGQCTLREGPPMPMGEHLYGAYLEGDEASSAYDEPALHVPASHVGALRRRIFETLGYTLVDRTEPIARLQERRARGQDAPPPRLSGAPALPKLRQRLDALGVTVADGEIELSEVHEVLRTDDRGRSAPVVLDLPFPVRAIFRCAESEVGAARHAIARAVEAWVMSLAEGLGLDNPLALDPEMRVFGERVFGPSEPPPDFVRSAIRALLFAELARGNEPLPLTVAPLFLTAAGSYISLRHLKEEEVLATADRSLLELAEPRVVFVAPAELSALRARDVAIRDVTDILRGVRTGKQRRAAPPLPSIALPEEVRVASLFTGAFEREGVRGEVGVLRPEHASFRGIFVHTTMRPLVMVAREDPGWPIAAVVNDDRVEPTPAFDGLVKAVDHARIVRAVRAAAAAIASEHMVAPKEAASLRLPFPFTAPTEDCEIGVLWLDREWPEEPTMRIEGHGFVEPAWVPRARLEGTRSETFPVRGIVHSMRGRQHIDAIVSRVMTWARSTLPALVRRVKDAEQTRAYEWDLRLSKILTDVDPLAELQKPEPDPVLLRVVAKRAPELLVPPKPEIVDERDVVLVEDAEFHEHEPFLGGLMRWAVELVTPRRVPLGDGALERALDALELTGDPIAAVVETRSGRPVRFETDTKTLVFNRSHRSVRALAGHPDRVLHLLLAAVSEVNRELESVTDAEELEVLRDLLRPPE